MVVRTVSNQAQLDAAIQETRGGDTILLSPGTYGFLQMNTSASRLSHVDFGSKVTIASADPGRPAVINEMLLRGASNIEFRDLKFDYGPSTSGSTPFWLQNTRNITLDDVTIEGHVSGGYGQGIGLRVDGSQDFSLLNSSLADFRIGMHVTSSGNVVISGNELRGMSFDAMFLGGIMRGTIAGNDFRAMTSPNVAHRDMIQFYNGAGEPPSRDITIRGNVIDNPEASHGIFFGNALARGGDLGAYYRNILIEDNHLRTAHLHGITVDHGAGVTIRNNTLVQNPDQGNTDMRHVPLINVAELSTQVTIQGNRVASVPDAAHSSWSVSGNVTGTRNVLHWDGGYRPGTSRPPFEPDPEAPSAQGGTDGGTGGGGEPGGETFRVGGARGDFFQFEPLDFAAGDELIFAGHDRGTFVGERGGNQLGIWEDGGAAKVNSIADLQELVRRSPAIEARTERAEDRLVLEIEQDDGAIEVVLEGLGAAFRDAGDFF